MPNPVAVPALIIQALMAAINVGVAIAVGFPVAWISLVSVVVILAIMAMTWGIGKHDKKPS